VLDGPEGRHASLARRLVAGQRADVTDGQGQLVECVVTAASPGRVELAVQARRCEPEPEPRVVVVQALCKGDRGELAVELMTEVGVDVVVPWAAERCIARWRGERAGKALERWRATAREAAKQSRRARFPEITEQADTEAVTALAGAAGLAVLLDPEAPDALGTVAFPDRGDIVLIVGPEGGISPAESGVLVRAGASSARLGPTVLRASSAGAVAAALALGGCGRWV
jgi:16S rRNA (uracil1498-N3)-methyltransferase